MYASGRWAVLGGQLVWNLPEVTVGDDDLGYNHRIIKVGKGL